MRHPYSISLISMFVLVFAGDGVAADGKTIPRKLIDKNEVDEVRAAIRRGADVNAAYDDNGLNALHIATAMRAHDVLEVLLKHKANPNAASTVGWTPLMNTALSNSPRMAATLIKHGAKVNQQDKSGSTALSYAAHLNFTKVAQLLLSQRAKVNVADKNGETPLWKAAARGNVEVLQVLVKHRANVNVKDKNGRSALAVAKEKKHDKAIAFLKRHGAR